MAIQVWGLVADALNVFVPLIESLVAPIRWFASSSFRTQARERWRQNSLSVRIGEVGMWAIAWLVVLAVGAFGIAMWLSHASL